MKKMDTTVTVQKPIKEVWDYINNPDNMPKWLDNFDHYEHVSGERGEAGSKGRHYYDEKGRKFSMEEELLEIRAPEYLKIELTSKPMDMIIENDLKVTDKNTTELRAVAEFTRVSLPMKLMMAIFMPAKKSQAIHVKQMNKLKELIEQE